MKRIFTSLAPNLEKDDLALSLSLLLRPWQYRRGDSAKKLERWFEEFTGFAAATAFTSGRGALYGILSALNLPKGSEVLVQGYTCVAVPGPALWAGLTPIYVDCDASLTMSVEDLARKITPRAKVLIIQHTFGAPAHLDELLAVAKRHGLFVIEDCAHALGSTYRGGRLGSFGDASFFSFGRDKVLSSVFGGVAVVRDEAIGRKVQDFAKRQGLPGPSWVLQQLMHAPTLAFAKAFYDVLALGRVKLFLALKLGVISRAVYPVERKGGKVDSLCLAMPEASARLALSQLAKLDRFSAHRRKVCEWYTRELDELGLTYQEMHGGIALRLAVFSEKAHELIQFVRKRHIELGDWYTIPVAPTGVDMGAVGYVVGSCPAAERYAATTFNLPTHIGIGEREVRQIMDVIRDFLGNANQNVRR